MAKPSGNSKNIDNEGSGDVVSQFDDENISEELREKLEEITKTEWTRRLSDSGKINFPPPLRNRRFLIIEPEATENVPSDEIHFYPEDEPITLNTALAGEVRRGLMQRGQITIPADFRRKSDFPMERCDVTVIEQDGRIIVKDPELVENNESSEDENAENESFEGDLSD